ncbi:MAG: BON domain-containing protein [Pseudomonadota bacterium]|nr:BON domain-containing protein [Pseudomonadota bacterium]
MALRDLWRGGRRERAQEHERYPLDPLSRDSWRDEAEARYGARAHRDHDEDPRQHHDRWENSHSAAGYAGSEQQHNYDRGYDQHRGSRYRGDQQRGGQDTDGQSYGGSGNNPFYGDHPLMRAGASYDYGYFGSKAGLPTTPWRRDNDSSEFDDLVYGGRSLDANETGETRGQHRGRGPRGYRRSDERIKEDVCQCLTDDHHIDATEIEVAVNDREVVLSGTVTSRAQKRHAEDLIERLSGVRDVINNLRVVSNAATAPSNLSQAPRPGGTSR